MGMDTFIFENIVFSENMVRNFSNILSYSSAFCVGGGKKKIRHNSVRSYKQLELIAVVFILNTFECFL